MQHWAVAYRVTCLGVALTYVLPQEKTLYILERLLKRQEELGFRPKVLYLDKGFSRGDIIRYLQEANVPAIIACPVRGKQGKGGTRALCRGRKAHRTPYTFTDGTSADLAVVPTLKRNRKTGKSERT